MCPGLAGIAVKTAERIAKRMAEKVDYESMCRRAK